MDAKSLKKLKELRELLNTNEKETKYFIEVFGCDIETNKNIPYNILIAYHRPSNANWSYRLVKII